MIEIGQVCEHLVWSYDKLLNTNPDISSTSELYLYHSICTADDQGGICHKEGQSEDNRDFVCISPHFLEGEFDNTNFYGSIIIVDNWDQIIDLCNRYPKINMYYTMGISTYPYNDKNIDFSGLVQEFINADCKNLHIAFLNGWDMYLDEFKEFDRAEKLAKDFEPIGYDRLKFLMANQTICRKYQRVLQGADVQYFTIYPLRISDSPGKKSWPDSILEKTGNKIRFKKLVCLNNFSKTHRTHIVDTITPYERDIYYSYRDKGIFLKKEAVNSYSRHRDHRFLRNQDSPPYRVISSAYAWIACETYFESNTDPTPGGENNWGDFEHKALTGFITEKTFKAFYFELPFLSVGLRNTHQHVSGLGFKLFPEIFDYSFDNIYDDDERMEAIKEVLVNYLETPILEIHEKFFSPQVQEKIKHNKKLITLMATNDPFNINAQNFRRS
jgi:hypothetical protein